MAARSLTDITYDKLKKKKKEVQFQKLWEDVSADAG